MLAGVGGAALDTGLRYAEGEDGEPLNTGIDLAEEQTGSENDRGIKAVATGALYVAVERGIIPFIKKATPLPVLTNIACWGVESVRTAAQVFSGKISVAAAVDRMGRIASAAIGDLCTKGIGKLCLRPSKNIHRRLIRAIKKPSGPPVSGMICTMRSAVFCSGKNAPVSSRTKSSCPRKNASTTAVFSLRSIVQVL